MASGPRASFRPMSSGTDSDSDVEELPSWIVAASRVSGLSSAATDRVLQSEQQRRKRERERQEEEDRRLALQLQAEEEASVAAEQERARARADEARERRRQAELSRQARNRAPGDPRGRGTAHSPLALSPIEILPPQGRAQGREYRRAPPRRRGPVRRGASLRAEALLEAAGAAAPPDFEENRSPQHRAARRRVIRLDSGSDTEPEEEPATPQCAPAVARRDALLPAYRDHPQGETLEPPAALQV